MQSWKLLEIRKNNPGTRWNLAAQRRNCAVVNSTILEGCEISRRIFRVLCKINPVRNFLVPKIPGVKILRPLYYRPTLRHTTPHHPLPPAYFRLSVMRLLDFNAELGALLLSSPLRMLQLLELAAARLQQRLHQDMPGLLPKEKLYVRCAHLPMTEDTYKRTVSEIRRCLPSSRPLRQRPALDRCLIQGSRDNRGRLRRLLRCGP